MPHFFALLDYVSNRLWSWGSSALIGSAVVLLISLVLWRLCEDRLSPRLGFWLFFLVLVRPLAPIEVPIPNYLAVWIPGSMTQTMIVRSDLSSENRTSDTERSVNSISVTSIASSEMLSPSSVGAELLTSADQKLEVKGHSSTGSISGTAIKVHPDSRVITVDSTWPWTKLVAVAYLLSVLFLFCRFVIQHLRWKRAILTASVIGVKELNIDLSELLKIAKVHRAIRVVELAGISSPAIWGSRRPILVLPAQMWRTLSTDQLKWIVLHELAHVYRRDGVIQLFQRCLLILQFWNPFAWVANYFMNRCREDDCDDLALHWSERNFVSAGEAFIHVVQYAMQLTRPVATISPAAITLFSSSSGRSCNRRLKRLLDSERKLHKSYGLKFYGLLTLACLVLLPSIHLVTVAQEPPPTIPASIESAETTRTFELRVVDSDGHAVPNAEVEIRSRPKQTLKVLSGSKQADGTYGQFTHTDDSGILAIQFSGPELKDVSFSIFAASFAPYCANWSMPARSETLPDSFTATLDAGRSVGGVIVDEEGKGIENAEVHPSVEYKKRAEDLRQLGVGKRYKTDAKGLWRVDTIPANEPNVYVTVTHPDFMPTSAKLEANKFLLSHNVEPSEKITLSRGLTLSGLVSDANGEPIAGAIVRTLLRNERLETTTNNEGVYAMLRCAEGSTPVGVTATGFGPEVKDVNIQPGMSPVDFVLPPGKRIRVRVTEADGKPIAKTRMFHQRWRNKTNFDYQMGLKMHENTDEDGIWEWSSAPEDTMVFDICPPKFMQIVDQSLIARDEEYHFVATPLLTIAGAVLDAETRQPIKNFHVTPGNRWPGKSEPFWHDRDAFRGTDGMFEMVIDRVVGTQLLTLKSSGYAPVTTRDIRWDEGPLKIEFALNKAQAIVIPVLGPDDAPAVNAEAALGVGDTQIVVSDGKFSSSTFAERVSCDKFGQLNLGARTEPVALIIVHESGYAEAVYDPTKPIEEPIRLVAWGKVEGRLQIAEAIGAEREIVLQYNGKEDVGKLARVRHDNKVTTTATGEFRFERVLPVSANIGINVITHSSRGGHTSAMSHRYVIDIKPGETTSIDLGGTGHSVKGKLIPPANPRETVDWEFSRITIKNALGLPPLVPYPAELETDAERENWFQNWRITPAALPWLASAAAYSKKQNAVVRYMCRVDQDGTFAIHDLPSGSFTFEFKLNFPGKDWGRLLGELKFPFSIDADDYRRTTVDLGELQVKPSE